MRMRTKIFPDYGFLAELLAGSTNHVRKSEQQGLVTQTRTDIASGGPCNRFIATGLSLCMPQCMCAKPPVRIGLGEMLLIVPSIYNSAGTSPQAFERSTSNRWAVPWSRSCCSNGDPLSSAYNSDLEQC